MWAFSSAHQPAPPQTPLGKQQAIALMKTISIVSVGSHGNVIQSLVMWIVRSVRRITLNVKTSQSFGEHRVFFFFFSHTQVIIR